LITVGKNFRYMNQEDEIRELNDKLDLIYLGLAMNNICSECFQPLDDDEIHTDDECIYNQKKLEELQKSLGSISLTDDDAPAWVHSAWDFLNSSTGDFGNDD